MSRANETLTEYRQTMRDGKMQMFRKQYPKGTRLELVSMDDPQAPPVGTRGTVVCVDDAFQLVMHWDNGQTLSLIPGIDGFKEA